ncbi:MAG: exodeoxyribonuclease V subunit gamma [Deltaproteobacteria bacterium]|nr:exodeoxyribonuclease V subunit gamma [Deltaproteobacteria bacterium]
MRRSRHRGDFCPELEDALVRELEGCKTRDPFAPVLVLCPTSLLRQHLQRVCTERTGGMCNVRFLTLGHYRDSLAAPGLAQSDLRPAPRGAAEAVVARLAREGGLDGTDLGGIARSPGFACAAAQTIRDLREAGISAAALRAAHENRRETLALLISALEESFRGAGWADDAALWEVAASVAPREPAGAVFLYGLYDLAPRQWDLVRAVCSDGDRDVVAFLPSGAAEAFRFTADFDAKLEEMGFRDVVAPACDDPIAPTLRALRSRLFAREPAGSPAPDGGLRIVAAPGEAREAREVARAALDAVRELDVPFREIAVLLRGDELRDELALAFDAAGIPAMARGPTASRDPGLRALRLLCEAARSGLGRAATLELLTADVLDPAGLVGADLADGFSPSLWDALTRRLGIVRGAADFRRRLQAHARSFDEETSALRIRQTAALGVAIDRLDEALSAVPARAPLGRFAAAFDSCRPLLADAARRGPSWTAALEAMRELDLVAGEVDLADVVRLVEAEGDQPLDQPGRLGDGGVTIGEIMSARGVPFDVVIVPRLSERVFPRPVRSDPLLSDEDREDLARRTGRPIPIKARSSDEERLLFRLAVGAARKRLVLTYPHIDPERGTARAPSLYVFLALEAVRGSHAGESSLGSDPAVERVSLSRLHPPAPERVLDRREWLIQQIDGAIALGDPTRAGAALSGQPHAVAGIRLDSARFVSRRLTEYDGLIVSAEARAIASGALDRTALSASRLEAWAACPFRFFMSHVLGLERPEEPEAEHTIDPRVRGSLVHRILERFVAGWIDGDGAAAAAVEKARLERVAAEELARFEADGGPGAPVLWRAERSAIESDLEVWLERELGSGSGMRPVSVEHEFGPDTDAAPVVLEEGGRRLRFAGRIDRIDVAADRSLGLVVDYKTGRPHEGLAPDSILGGRAVQLAIYVLAARARHPDVRRWTAAYDHLSRAAGIRRITWDEGEGALRLGDLARAVGLVTEGVDSGLFLQDPSSCAGCQFASACSPAVELVARRKSEDERADPFRRLREIP